MGAMCSCCFESKDNSQKMPLLLDLPVQHSCPAEKSDDNTQRKSLLSDNERNKSYAAQNANDGVVVVSPTPVARSARQYAAPKDETKQKDFTTSIQQVQAIVIEDLPSKLSRLDKSLKDHAKLYNDQYDNFEALRQTLNKFKEHFVKDTSGIPDIKSCLEIMAAQCGDAKLTTTRPSKHSMEIVYDRREVSENCRGLPEDVLQQLELFNKMNHLIKSLLDKIPTVQRSIRLVLDQEEEHCRSVFKEYSNAEGPDALKRVKEQLRQLRKAPEQLDTIKKYTEHTWNDLLQGSSALCRDDGGKEERRRQK